MKINRLSMNRVTSRLYTISIGNLIFCRIGSDGIDAFDCIFYHNLDITGRIVILMDDALIFSCFSRYNV